MHFEFAPIAGTPENPTTLNLITLLRLDNNSACLHRSNVWSASEKVGMNETHAPSPPFDPDTDESGHCAGYRATAPCRKTLMGLQNQHGHHNLKRTRHQVHSAANIILN